MRFSLFFWEASLWMLRQKSLGAFYPVSGRKFLHILRMKTQLHANSWKRCVQRTQKNGTRPTRLKLHMRQTIQEDMQVLWKESVHSCEHVISLNRLMNPVVKVLLTNTSFVSLFRFVRMSEFWTQISRPLAYGVRISPRASATTACEHRYCQLLRDMVKLTSYRTECVYCSKNIPISQSKVAIPSRAANAMTPSVCTLSNPAKDVFWDAAHTLKNDRIAHKCQRTTVRYSSSVCQYCRLRQNLLLCLRWFHYRKNSNWIFLKVFAQLLISSSTLK